MFRSYIGSHRWSRFVAFTVLALLGSAACADLTPDSPGDAAGTGSGRSAPELFNRVTNAYPAFSPDGRRIAYMSTADGDFDIYVVFPAEGRRIKLTDTDAREGTPTWSPDGSRIAFQSFRDRRSQIYVMNADGSDQRNVSNSEWHDEHPFWSADGERLLFASNRSATTEAPDNFDIFEMRIDGSGVRRITDTPQVETYPSWSPDGTRIAARKIMPDGNWEIVLMDANGSNPRVVAPHPAADGWPVWSPEGRRLVFSSERAGTADLWLLDLETDELRRLTWDDEADERQPWFSPDGNRVVYARYRWFPDQPFYEASEIFVVEVPTAPDAVIAASNAGTPRARAHHRLVSGPAGEVLLVGGSTRTDSGYVWFDDVWSWRAHSAAWIRLDPLPFTRSSHALAYDRARREVVLIGGIGGPGDNAGGTVWLWAGEDWERRDEVSDDGWAEPAACYDRARERVVVFGGWDRDNEFRGDTWEWDGRELVSVARAGPAARAGHDMAFDLVEGRCIMFGGRGEDGFLSDTWAWNGGTWEQVATGAEGPPPRWFFGMTTADAWDRVVLFGGATDEGDLADSWEWNGAAWSRVEVEGPPARAMSRIAFDGEYVLLFGGRQRRQGSPPFVDLADAWLFDGERWLEASP
jgi:Tol biopolymer transport system component